MKDILKPFGAFIEYTVKPMFDQMREVLDILEKQGIPAKDMKKIAVKLYIFHELVNLILSITVTGLICYTCITILR